MSANDVVQESEHRDRRNRFAARFWAILAVTGVLTFGIIKKEQLTWWYVALVLGLGFLASRSHSTRHRHAGWAFVALLVLVIYVPAIAPSSYSWETIKVATLTRFSGNTDILISDGERFKDAYVIIASAAFTLYGFFFLATRRVARIQTGVRLLTIAQVFGSILTLGVTGTLLRDSGWWRYAILLLIASSTLYAISQEPRPYIVDMSVDRKGAATYWEAWLTSRRGQAIMSFSGLFVMPLWPVLGECLFVFGLLFLLLIAASTSTFLFLSSELPDSDRTDDQLRLLYGFKINPQFRDAPIRPFRMFGVRPSEARVTSIAFTFPRPPKQPED